MHHFYLLNNCIFSFFNNLINIKPTYWICSVCLFYLVEVTAQTSSLLESVTENQYIGLFVLSKIARFTHLLFFV
jgi:hypothetical protein